MRKLAIFLLLGFAVGSTATAATGWRVFGSASDSGAYTSNASASATVQKPAGLAFRVRGPRGPFLVTWSASCDGTSHSAGGQIVVLGVLQATTCTLSATATGGRGGPVRLELLRR